VAPDWVIDLLQGGGFESYRCSREEADRLLWGKLCVSCGINALTGLLRVVNGDLLERPEASELMIRAAEECACVARAKGIRLPFLDAGQRAKEVARQTARNKSSMYQDFLRGAPTECDWIYGPVVREAERLHVDVPVTTILWKLVRAAARKGADTGNACIE
jgi:2-dehydropantoate 2-reductase